MRLLRFAELGSASTFGCMYTHANHEDWTLTPGLRGPLKGLHKQTPLILRALLEHEG